MASEPHHVRFETNDQLMPECRSLSPNNNIPAIIDPNVPKDRPLVTCSYSGPGDVRPTRTSMEAAHKNLRHLSSLRIE